MPLPHAPVDANPAAFLQKSHRLCNQFTILSTTYTDPIIDNHLGCVEITPGSALFLPAVPESHMTVLREDLEEVPPGTTRRRLFRAVSF